MKRASKNKVPPAPGKPATQAPPTTFSTIVTGNVRHCVGNVVRHGGYEWIVISVVDSCARCVCLTREQRTVEDRLHDKVKTFHAPARIMSISATIEEAYILRRDIALAKQLAEKQNNKNKQKENNMSNKTPKTPKAPSLGGLGGLMGHPVTAILRRLGKEGVTVSHAKAIMKAQKVKTSDATISIQVSAGRNKNTDRGEPADITQAQVKELVGSAEDPTIAEEAEKAAKEAKAAADKAEKAATKAAAAKK